MLFKHHYHHYFFLSIIFILSFLFHTFFSTSIFLEDSEFFEDSVSKHELKPPKNSDLLKPNQHRIHDISSGEQITLK